MSLTTPEGIRRLQRKLYLKAKAEPDFRFYQLYDKVYQEDVLLHAYRLARANHGAPGVDGKTFEMIEAAGLEEWLSGLGEELRTKTYKPRPVWRVLIPKPGGGERPMGIPTIRDRVVQTAVKLIIEPIFEADLEPAVYGYRPQRSAQDAIKEVHTRLCQGFNEVVDADLSRYFDTIPNRELMQSVARRISDRLVLALIKMWLKTPVEEVDDQGRRRLTGGKRSKCGTPQGGVISPLLANLYLNRFLKYWRLRWMGAGQGSLGLDPASDDPPGLALNEAKTSIRRAREERFDFLGYTFGPHRFRKDGHWYLGASPSRKSLARLKQKVRVILNPGNVGAWPVVRERLNALLRGWSSYFCYGTRLLAYRAADNYVYKRVVHFLRRRHRVPTRGTRCFSDATVYGELGVLRLRRVHLGPPPCAMG